MVNTIANAAFEGRAVLSTMRAEEEEAAGIEGDEALERYLGPSTLAKIRAEAVVDEDEIAEVDDANDAENVEAEDFEEAEGDEVASVEEEEAVEAEVEEPAEPIIASPIAAALAAAPKEIDEEVTNEE
jgi:hypothetical protein